MTRPRNIAIYSDCSIHDDMKPIELYDKVIEGQKHRLVTASDNLTQDLKYALTEVRQWLPFAAEQYKISANINDYVCVPVIIMPSELPNKNGIGFPFDQLTKFNPDSGKIAFKTWQTKPCFLEHCNNDYTIAYGTVFDSIMKPMKNVKGDLWKVIALTAWDRTRYSDVVNDILTGKRNSYSMGALTSGFRCSICGAWHDENCGHVVYRKPNFKPIGGKVPYLRAMNPSAIEVSSVLHGAYISATSPPEWVINLNNIK